MLALTERQQQILSFIQHHLNKQGIPPTRADIAKAMGYRSANAAEDHLKALAKKGVITLSPGTSRGIRLVDENPAPVGVPIVGRVAAGSPILAEEHIEDHLDVTSNAFHPAADYLLRVEGESMKDIGILDQDLLAVHRRNHADNGQIVVARINDEVTVKRFKKTDQEILLLPENSDFQPIKVDPSNDDFHIEGLGVGVIRNQL